MTMESALIDYLKNDPDISAVVGSRIEPRRNSQMVPNPRILLWRGTSERFAHLQGQSGLSKPRIRIACVADDYMEAKELSELVRLCIDGFRGDMSGVDVQHILSADETDNDDPQPGDDQLGAFIIYSDFDIMHREPYMVPAWADSSD